MSTDRLYLPYFPFLPESTKIIADLDMTAQKIDDTNVFDTMLRSAADEILQAITAKDYYKLVTGFYLQHEAEVPKFYITMLLLAKLSPSIFNKYLKFYRHKIDRHIDILSQEQDSKFRNYLYCDIIERTAPRYRFKIQEYKKRPYFAIKLTDYFLLSSTISNRSEEYYAPLKLINMQVKDGYVVIIMNDWPLLSMLLNKIIENKIREIAQNLKGFESAKISKAVRELSDYMIKQNNINPIATDYNDVKYQLEEQKHAECVSKMLRNGLVPVKGFPPCINHILTDIRKGEHLTHAAKLLFNSYLIKKGFSKDQITDIWKHSPKFNETRTDMILDDLLDKVITPMNCDKVEANHLCHRQHDTQNICSRIRNPLTY